MTPLLLGTVLAVGTQVIPVACQAKGRQHGKLRKVAGRTPFSWKPGQSMDVIAMMFCFALECSC